jgi:hypothetical protein
MPRNGARKTPGNGRFPATMTGSRPFWSLRVMADVGSAGGGGQDR